MKPTTFLKIESTNNDSQSFHLFRTHAHLSCRVAISSAIAGALFAVSIASFSGCSRTPKLPADEDAFVSYLQSVTSLCERLKLRFETNPKKQQPSGFFGPSPIQPTNQLESELEAVIGYRDSVKALPADTRQKLAKSWGDLLTTTKSCYQQLKRQHEKKPQILKQDWERCRQAIEYVHEL